MSVLEQIEAYIAANNMAPSRFGREAAHDPRLVFDLRQGSRRLRNRTSKYLLAYMRAKHDT